MEKSLIGRFSRRSVGRLAGRSASPVILVFFLILWQQQKFTCIYIHNIHLEGTVSQSFNMGPSFISLTRNGKNLNHFHTYFSTFPKISLLTFDWGLGGCLVGVRLRVLADLDLGGLSLTVGARQVP